MDLATLRQQKDRSMREDRQSPLTPDQKEHFTGLAYFPENSALRFVLSLTLEPESPPIVMLTNTGSETAFRRIVSFEFAVAGSQLRLYLYQDEEGSYDFVPFMDETSGVETYGAGRYLEPRELADGAYSVDFNLAYNPYCAYNEHWSCPIPPLENRLPVRIEAGEKVFHQ